MWHNACQGYTLLVYSAFLWPVLKVVLGIVLSNSFMLRLYKVEGNYMPGTNPLCEFVRLFLSTCVKSVSNVNQLKGMVATYDFYPKPSVVQ